MSYKLNIAPPAWLRDVVVNTEILIDACLLLFIVSKSIQKPSKILASSRLNEQ